MPARSARACHAELTQALIRRDMDATLELLADNVLFFYSNGSAIRGRDAFASRMTKNWKLIEDYAYASADEIWLAQSEAEGCAHEHLSTGDWTAD